MQVIILVFLSMLNNELLNEINKLISLSNIGLLYCNNEYDKERYEEIRHISLRLLSELSSHDISLLKDAFPIAKDYPTAKVDIRGMLVSPEGKILFVQESIDGKWALPGGWADIGHSPKEVITKEFKEETGLDVIPQRLLAVFDKRKHLHPLQPFHVYKMVFYCKAISSEINKGFDVLDVQFFDIHNIPPLSEERILKTQIELLYRKIASSDTETYFD